MKRSFIPAFALVLSLACALAFAGCEGMNPVDTAELEAGRSVAESSEPIAVNVTGTVVTLDGALAVVCQCIPYFVSGADLTEGSFDPSLYSGSNVTVTVSGNAAPIIEWDGAGNSLFYGYSVKDGKVTISG